MYDANGNKKSEVDLRTVWLKDVRSRLADRTWEDGRAAAAVKIGVRGWR